MVVPEIPVMTNRFNPTGGVMAAISILSVSTMQKWIRLMSSALYGRQQQRRHHREQREAVEEAAEHQQNGVDQEQEAERRQVERA